MAADTAHADGPDPSPTPDANLPGGPIRGFIAEALAAEGIARPTPLHDAGEATDDAPVTGASGASSAAYHGTGEEPENAGSTPYKEQDEGIWKTFLRAAAIRWAKGGGTANKRLEVAKAQAMANQSKTVRTVSVNRSGAAGPSTGVGSGASSKPAPEKKSDANRPVKGEKNSPVGVRGPAEGARTAVGGSGVRGPGNNSSGGKAGSVTTPRGGRNKGDTDKDVGGAADTPRRAPKKTAEASADTDTGTGSKTKASKAKQPKHKDTPPTQPKASGPAASPKTAGEDQPVVAPDGKPYDTRTSRAAGRRNGVRVGKVLGHARAYKDGAKDGLGEMKDVADKEKDRNDQAYAAWKDRHAPKEQQVSGNATSTDFHTQPTPIEARWDEGKVLLGSGASRPSLERGEVKNLRGYQSRFEKKTDSMQKIAENTRGLEERARERAKQITFLRERAKGVEGGEKLMARLARLEESAKVQIQEAKEVHKRAVRAADGCQALLHNVDVRYGLIYQAVVDSGLLAPAELRFYMKGTSRG
ncbi:hypothetical protein ACIG3E_33015 [Streptomyces sp. NPDC053474]|uniref:hypothetical protein n=1 Tax=Streptomyces sp. NPDC053474 TaxID=3365704 RepID=UPI0037D00E5C